jgi:sulfatase maturation enzyme AslB (radical SAM superfamily)
MRAWTVFRVWGKILRGRRPALSIEVTRECPLQCPGCYAYEPQHLGGGTTLRQLSDYKGQRLVDGILELVDQYRPVHVSLVGGDPLVRYREMEAVLPRLAARGIHVQLVTSAFRPMAAEWARLPRLTVAVSIDGLAAEHDVRRSPATYERILKNIAGQRVAIHCTVTGQMMQRSGYLEEFLRFWSPRSEVRRIWFSLFTPQRGAVLPEVLTAAQRARAISELLDLRQRYTKLDMGPGVIRAFARPPSSPEECVFAQTTHTVSADLTTLIQPCQFGGDPDCSACGCMASMGLAAVAEHRVLGVLPIGAVLWRSLRAGRAMGQARAPVRPQAAFPILK